MNKTYAKMPTRKRRVAKANKQIVIIAVLVALIAVCNIIGAINYVKLYRVKAVVPTFVDYQKDEPVSIWQQISDITGGENVNVLYNLAKCESGLNVYAVGMNATNYDRGFYQINSYYHAEVSDNCAFDLVCSTKWTNNMINAGQLHQWTCSDHI